MSSSDSAPSSSSSGKGKGTKSSSSLSSEQCLADSSEAVHSTTGIVIKEERPDTPKEAAGTKSRRDVLIRSGDSTTTSSL